MPVKEGALTHTCMLSQRRAPEAKAVPIAFMPCGRAHLPYQHHRALTCAINLRFWRRCAVLIAP